MPGLLCPLLHPVGRLVQHQRRGYVPTVLLPLAIPFACSVFPHVSAHCIVRQNVRVRPLVPPFQLLMARYLRYRPLQEQLCSGITRESNLDSSMLHRNSK